jgi:hypothetical protein
MDGSLVIVWVAMWNCLPEYLNFIFQHSTSTTPNLSSFSTQALDNANDGFSAALF